VTRGLWTGPVEVKDTNWLVWFVVCPHPLDNLVGIVYRCKRKNFVGPEEEGWRASVSNIAVAAIASKARLNRFVFGQLTDETLSQMTSAIKAVLDVWASNNRLDRLIGKHEPEYPYN
jgi:hypothetical protein